MKLQIERGHLEAMVEAFPELSPLGEQLRFGNRAEIPFHQLSAGLLAHPRGLHEAKGPAGHPRRALRAGEPEAAS